VALVEARHIASIGPARSDVCRQAGRHFPGPTATHTHARRTLAPKRGPLGPAGTDTRNVRLSVRGIKAHGMRARSQRFASHASRGSSFSRPR